MNLIKPWWHSDTNGLMGHGAPPAGMFRHFPMYFALRKTKTSVDRLLWNRVIRTIYSQYANFNIQVFIYAMGTVAPRDRASR